MKSVLQKIRQKLLMWRVEWEIYHRIFPHLNAAKNANYPFQNHDELFGTCIHGDLDMTHRLRLLEKQADDLGEAYGRAFRYIVYRDMNQKMEAYLRCVQERLPKRLREPAFA